MPELPEVETTARGLRALIVGCRIGAVGGIDWPRMLPTSAPDELARALVGRTIQAVERRGKYLLLRLDDAASLAVHRKMTGNLVVVPSVAPRQPHTHLALSLEDGRDMRFVDPRKFGRVYYFPTPEALERFLAERLGPEPLGELGVERLAELLRRRRGRLKSLLLNQLFLAGIGNLYADEILWAARLHPERTASSLSLAEVERLHQAVQRVLLEAIARRGTSLSTYRDASGEPGENQAFLQVYGRAGAPCLRCGTPIARKLLGARGTWFCPQCQRPEGGG
ncbi:MAG: DNA-formamidopyrimidine glycosylase [Chloroflexi bacterium]|nr:DNA-formamidopyrimidine glycosylase [Chloroflexota bacterium]